MLIRSRLIDYARKERRHRQTVSLDAPAAGEKSAPLGETLPEERGPPRGIRPQAGHPAGD